jgi:hypothetical protein
VTPSALAVRCLAKHFGADEAAVLQLAAEQVAATTIAEANEERELSQRANAVLSSNMLLSFSTCSKIGWATPRFCHRPPRINLEKRLAFPSHRAILPLR